MRAAQTLCTRCSAELSKVGWSVSYMTSETICLDCKERETQHPRYAEAKAAELKAMEMGEWNYAGLFDTNREVIADLYAKPRSSTGGEH